MVHKGCNFNFFFIFKSKVNIKTLFQDVWQSVGWDCSEFEKLKIIIIEK